jgi:hypothetical protein
MRLCTARKLGVTRDLVNASRSFHSDWTDECRAMDRTHDRPTSKAALAFALLLVLAALLFCCVGLVLARNEYAAMDPGLATVPDCDIDAADPFLLSAFAAGGVVVAALAKRALRERGLALLLVLISAVIMMSIGASTPTYLKERERARQLCSP